MTARTSERGATAVEYGIIVAGIAIVIVAALYLFGQNLFGSFYNSADAVSAAVGGGDADVEGPTATPPAAFSVTWTARAVNSLEAEWGPVAGTAPITFTVLYVIGSCASTPTWESATPAGTSSANPGSITTGDLGNGNRCAVVRAVNSAGTTYSGTFNGNP